MPFIPLSQTQIISIKTAVENMFDRLKSRLLGPQSIDKRIAIGYAPELTLSHLYTAAAIEEGARPDGGMLRSIMHIAEGYIDGEREKAKSMVVKEVEAFLHEAQSKGIKTDTRTVLGGRLADVFGKVYNNTKRIIDSEAQNARNGGALDGIVKINASQGIEDPLIYFVVVRDQYLCDECKRLHLTPVGKPRVWKLSELGAGYHKKGQNNPKFGGLHPHCRCTMATLMPGWGFSKAGMVTYIGPGHDEYKAQVIYRV